MEGRVAPADERTWEFRDPALLTWEVQDLSNWLEALASGQAVEKREDFLVPNLRFEVAARDEDTITIRVYFELEARPPWFFADAAGMNDLWIDLLVDRDDVRVAARDLHEDLARFPPREVRPRRYFRFSLSSRQRCSRSLISASSPLFIGS